MIRRFQMPPQVAEKDLTATRGEICANILWLNTEDVIALL